MKIIFKAVMGCPFPKDKAQEVGEELWRLATDGELPRAHEIVEEAKKKTSPLHDYFEWDDGIAGDKWREHQARQIINHLVIVKKAADDGDIEVKAFFNVSKAADPEDEEARRYVSVFSVLNNDDFHQQVLKQALSEIQTWREKYRILKELHEVFETVEKVQKSLKF